MIVIYRDKLDFNILNNSRRLRDRSVRDDNFFLPQKVSKMFPLKEDFSLRTHVFEIFHLIFLEQHLFLNVLDYINVAYECNFSTTSERKQFRKSKSRKKLTSSLRL